MPKKMKFKDRVDNYLHEIIKNKTSPHSIAIGFSIGTFISIIPTPGFNILLGVLIVFLYKQINKFSLFGSMAFWNPIVVSPLYLLSYKIGNILFSSKPVIKYNVVILDQIYNFSRRFLVGNIIVAITFSIVFYFIVKYLIKFLIYKHIIKNPIN